MHYHILPSILSADLTRLGEEVDAVMQAGADMIHFDVMDNHYVPNLTFGPILCQNLRTRFPTLPIDVHLMVTPVDHLIEKFAEAGATRISIHPEATLHLDRSLQLIKQKGCEAGLVLNPGTSINHIQWVKQYLDFILVMTVNPGFAGQKLIPSALHKVKEIHRKYPTIPLCVDGGIDIHTISEAAKAGATQFVAGSAIFTQDNYKNTIAQLRQQLNQV
ncbi:ribulose-phosphate 3-epimerase (plasmid) [Legionella adelaidensis]|uniref:Ribulose-phosphate 3-epimerase n=1 Tax=Legionella adelaidensis TaxID=45056 RepID=A0A0W0R4D1_9GAMM|nr:ribulose-phosphate 3-epimerase [Legionella adelaidensis]KTC65937.1 ribulose-phosphate 3-epimerase [Legionella adelaidensis]VEH85557.1 ribulose-phosphate 3-epimerase [Legionella adelaidensis]